ncbi:MAG: tetratricopeptide repeat protein, partial [Bacillota bacterium]
IVTLIYTGNQFLGNILLISYMAFTIWKNLPMFYAVSGSKAYNKGDMEKALRLFKKASESRNTKPNIISSYGFLLLRNGNMEEAENYLVRASEEVDRDPRLKQSTILNLAILRWKQGRFDEAIEMVEKSKEEYKNTGVYQILGYLLMSSGNLEKSLALNTEAHEFNKSDSVIADNLAETYYFLGERDKAEAIYEEIEDTVKFPEALYYYGLILWDKGEWHKANEMFERATRLKASFLSNITDAAIAEKYEEFKAAAAGKGIDLNSPSEETDLSESEETTEEKESAETEESEESNKEQQ